MATWTPRCAPLVASALTVLLAAAGCGGSGGSSAPPGLTPDDRDPAALPQGAGTATIDMAGTWEIAAFTVEEWESWSTRPVVAELPGQRFTIAAAGRGGFALRTFCWVPDLDPTGGQRAHWSVGWERNVGDGRLLIYAFSGTVTGQIITPPGQRRVPHYALGVALGAIGPDEMLGRFVEAGGGAGLRGFTFLARRVRHGSVEPDPRDAARLPDTTVRGSIDMAGEWRIREADVEVYEPSIHGGGGPPDLVGRSLRIDARSARRFELDAFAWHEPIGMATPAGWNVTWSRNEGDGTVLIYSRNSVATGLGPGLGRSVHRFGIALVAVSVNELLGRYVEYGGPGYVGTFAFTFLVRRER